MDTKKLGIFGERIACYYLEKKGYKILDKNYVKELSAVSKGEIDIVARKEDIITFVEVKTLSNKDSVFNPEDRVDFQKQKQLVKLAQIWLSGKKMPLDSKWQIDVVSIRVDFNSKKAKIRHFKNAVC